MNLKQVLYTFCVYLYVQIAKMLILFKTNPPINHANIQKILVIHPQRIGDFLVLQPMIRALKKRFSQIPISFLASNDIKPLAERDPSLAKVFVFDEINVGLWEFLRLYHTLKKQSFDLIINCQTGFTNFKRTLLPLTGKRYRIGFRRGGFVDLFATHLIEMPKQHIIRQFPELLTPLGINNIDLTLKIFYSDNDTQFVKTLLEKHGFKNKDRLVIIHPGNRNPLKRWKPEYFAKLADGLVKKKDIRIVLTGIKEDLPIVKEIQDLMKMPSLNLIGQTDVLQLSTLIAKASLLISVDTAPIHIASATNTPTIGIYGPTETFYWGAWNIKNQKIIETWPSCKLCENNDFNKIFHPIKCNQKENICMSQIKPQIVLEEALKLLK